MEGGATRVEVRGQCARVSGAGCNACESGVLQGTGAWGRHDDCTWQRSDRVRAVSE